jgi:hypothetical protein
VSHPRYNAVVCLSSVTCEATRSLRTPILRQDAAVGARGSALSCLGNFPPTSKTLVRFENSAVQLPCIRIKHESYKHTLYLPPSTRREQGNSLARNFHRQHLNTCQTGIYINTSQQLGSTQRASMGSYTGLKRRVLLVMLVLAAAVAWCAPLVQGRLLLHRGDQLQKDGGKRPIWMQLDVMFRNLQSCLCKAVV